MSAAGEITLFNVLSRKKRVSSCFNGKSPLRNHRRPPVITNYKRRIIVIIMIIQTIKPNSDYRSIIGTI